MAINEYLPFATDGAANVLSPATYSASPLLPIGHQPGVALSEVANTTWRQTSVGIAGIAQMICDTTGADMDDDGDSDAFKTKLLAALNRLIATQQYWKTGDIKSTLDSTAQTGWVYCNGQAISRSGANAALFAKLGIQHGAGDGSTTFNVPDLRAYFTRGLDDGRGFDVGRSVLGSYQQDAVGAHTHATGWPIWDEGGQTNNHMGSGGPTAEGVTFALATGGVVGSAPETRPLNIAVRFLIKL